MNWSVVVCVRVYVYVCVCVLFSGPVGSRESALQATSVRLVAPITPRRARRGAGTSVSGESSVLGRVHQVL